MSGTSLSCESKRYRPEKTLRRMSTSAGLEIIAGSKSATSWARGKDRVWSAASGSGDGPGVEVGLHATIAMASATTNFLTGPARYRIGLDSIGPEFQLGRRSSAWLEQRSFKPMVRGSSPRAGTTDLDSYSNRAFFTLRNALGSMEAVIVPWVQWSRIRSTPIASSRQIAAWRPP